jgi:hypothetical protein
MSLRAVHEIGALPSPPTATFPHFTSRFKNLYSKQVSPYPEEELVHIRVPRVIGERSRVDEQQRGADLTQLCVQCALATKPALQVIRGPTKLAWDEDARASSFGGLCDGHLGVDGHQTDRGYDNVHAGKGRSERGHVGILCGRYAYTTRSERLILVLIAGVLRCCDYAWLVISRAR